MSLFPAALLVCTALNIAPPAKADTGLATASDMYVACYLYANKTSVPKRENDALEKFAGEQCAAAAAFNLANREGKLEAAKSKKKKGGEDANKYRFCLPDTPELRTDPARSMAFAYMSYFEGKPQIAGKRGDAAYTIALVEKWPCS